MSFNTISLRILLLQLLLIITTILLTIISSSSSSLNKLFVDAAVICSAGSTETIDGDNTPGTVLQINRIEAGCVMTIRNSHFAAIILPLGPYINGHLIIENVECHSKTHSDCLIFQKQLDNFATLNITGLYKRNPDDPGSLPSNNIRNLVSFELGGTASSIATIILDDLVYHSPYLKTTESLYFSLVNISQAITATTITMKNLHLQVDNLDMPTSGTFRYFILDTAPKAPITVSNNMSISNVLFKLQYLVNDNNDVYIGDSSANAAMIHFHGVHGTVVADGATPSSEGLFLNNITSLIGNATDSAVSRTINILFYNLIKFSAADVATSFDVVRDLKRIELTDMTINISNYITTEHIGAYMINSAGDFHNVKNFLVDSANVNVHGSMSSAANKVIYLYIFFIPSFQYADSISVANSNIYFGRGNAPMTVNYGRLTADIARISSTGNDFVLCNISNSGILVDEGVKVQRMILNVLLINQAISVAKVFIDQSFVKVLPGVEVGTQHLFLKFFQAVNSVAGASTVPIADRSLQITNSEILVDTVKADTMDIGFFVFDNLVRDFNSLLLDSSKLEARNPNPITLAGSGTVLSVNALWLASISSTIQNINNVNISDTNVSVFQDFEVFRGIGSANEDKRKLTSAEVKLARIRNVINCGFSFLNNNFIAHVNTTQLTDLSWADFGNVINSFTHLIVEENTADIVAESAESDAMFRAVYFDDDLNSGDQFTVRNNNNISVSLIARSGNTHTSLVQFQPNHKASDIKEGILIDNNIMRLNVLRSYSGGSIVSLLLFQKLEETFYLNITNNNLLAATALGKSDPSTPSWLGKESPDGTIGNNLEFSDPVSERLLKEDPSYPAEATHLGALSWIPSPTANAVFFNLHILHLKDVITDMKNTATDEYGGIFVDSNSIIAADFERDEKLSPVPGGCGGFRRQHTIVRLYSFGLLVTNPKQIHVENSFVSVNTNSTYIYGTVLALFRGIKYSSLPDEEENNNNFIVRNSTIIVNGTSHNNALYPENIHVLQISSPKETAADYHVINLNSIRIYDSNITIFESLTSIKTNIAVADISRLNVTSDLTVDGVVFNINNITAPAEATPVISAILFHGDAYMLTANKSISLSNVYYQKFFLECTYPSFDAQANVTLIHVALNSLDQDPTTSLVYLPHLTVSNVSGEIEKIETVQGSAIFRFIFVNINSNWRNVTVKNVSNLYIQQFGTTYANSNGSPLPQFQMVAVAPPTTGQFVVDQGVNFFISDINIEFDYVYGHTPRVLAGVVFNEGVLNHLQSWVTTRVALKVNRMSVGQQGLYTVTMAGLGYANNIGSLQPGVYIVMKDCIVEAAASSSMFKVTGLFIAGILRDATASTLDSSQASTASQSFALFDNVTLNADVNLDFSGPISLPQKSTNVRVLFIRNGVGNIFYPVSNFREATDDPDQVTALRPLLYSPDTGLVGQGGAFVFRNCHAFLNHSRTTAFSATLPSFGVLIFHVDQVMTNVTTLNFTLCSSTTIHPWAGTHSGFSAILQPGNDVEYIGMLRDDDGTLASNSAGGTIASTESDAVQSGIYIDRCRASTTARFDKDPQAGHMAGNLYGLPVGAVMISFSGPLSNVKTIIIKNCEVEVDIESLDLDEPRPIVASTVLMVASASNITSGFFIKNNTITVARAQTSKWLRVAPLCLFHFMDDSTELVLTVNNTNPVSETDGSRNYGLHFESNKISVNVVPSHTNYPRSVIISSCLLSVTHEIRSVINPTKINSQSNLIKDSNVSCTQCHVGTIVSFKKFSDVYRMRLHNSAVIDSTFWSMKLINPTAGENPNSTLPLLSVSVASFNESFAAAFETFLLTDCKMQNLTLVSTRSPAEVEHKSSKTLDPSVVGLLMLSSSRTLSESEFSSSRYFSKSKLTLFGNTIENVFLLTSSSSSDFDMYPSSNILDQITLVKLYYTPLFLGKGIVFQNNQIKNCVANSIHFITSTDTDHHHLGWNRDLPSSSPIPPIAIYNLSSLQLTNNRLEQNCRYITNSTFIKNEKDLLFKYSTDADFPSESLINVPFFPFIVDDATFGVLNPARKGVVTMQLTDNYIDNSANETFSSCDTPDELANLVSSFNPLVADALRLQDQTFFHSNFSEYDRRRFSMFRFMKRIPDNDRDSDVVARFNEQVNISLTVENNQMYCVGTPPPSSSSSLMTTSATRINPFFKSCSILQLDSQEINESHSAAPMFFNNGTDSKSFIKNTLRGTPYQFKTDKTVFFIDVIDNATTSLSLQEPSHLVFENNTMRHGQIHPIIDTIAWMKSGYDNDPSSSSTVVADLRQSEVVFKCNDFEFAIERDFNAYVKPSTSSTSWKQCGSNNNNIIHYRPTRESQSLSRSETETKNTASQSFNTTLSKSNTTGEDGEAPLLQTNTSFTRPTLSGETSTSTHSHPTTSFSKSKEQTPSPVEISESESLTPTPTIELEQTDSATIQLPIIVKKKNSFVEPVPATFTLVSSMTSVATGASVVGPLAIRNGLILGVLGCGQDPEPLDLGTHPTQMELRTGHGKDGDDSYAHWRGVILGNFLCILGGGLLVFGIPFFVKKTQVGIKETKTKTREERAEEVATTIFNKLLILWGVAWIVLSAPATSGMAAALAYGRIGTADNIGLWIVVVLLGPFVGAVPPVVVTLVCWRVQKEGVQLAIVDTNRNKKNDKNYSGNVARTKNMMGDTGEDSHEVEGNGSSSTTSSSNDSDEKNKNKNHSDDGHHDNDEDDQHHGPCVRGLLRIADFFFASYKGLEWPIADPFVKRWGFLFEHSKILYVAYLEQVLGFILNVAVGLAQGRDVTRLQCQLLAIFICVIQLPMLIWVIFLQPMLTRFDQYVSVIMYTANIITAVLVVVEVFNTDENDVADSEDKQNGGGGISTPLYSLSMAQAALNLLAALSYLTYFVRVGFRKKLQKEEEIEKKQEEQQNANFFNGRDGNHQYQEGERTKLDFNNRWEELLLQGKNGEVDDEYVDIIADVLALPSHEIDDDFADMLENEMESRQTTASNFNRTHDGADADDEIDLSMLLDSDDNNNDTTKQQENNNDYDEYGMNNNTMNNLEKEKQEVKPKLLYELDDDDDDEARFKNLYELDEDMDDETRARREAEMGIGAARNAELEMRRLELQGMLQSIANNNDNDSSMVATNPSVALSQNEVAGL